MQYSEVTWVARAILSILKTITTRKKEVVVTNKKGINVSSTLQ